MAYLVLTRTEVKSYSAVLRLPWLSVLYLGFEESRVARHHGTSRISTWLRHRYHVHIAKTDVTDTELLLFSG